MVIKIDELYPKEITCLVGKEQGEDFYKRLIDFLDQDIYIDIPESVIVINKPFFYGAFGSIIQDIGKEQFFLKVRFSNQEVFINGLDSYVDFCLKRNKNRVMY